MSKPIGYIDAGLNDVTAWDGAGRMVPPGLYHLRCTKNEGGESKAGKPKMTLTYEVIERLDEDDQSVKGQTIQQSQSVDVSNDTVKRRLRSLTDALIGGPDERGGFDGSAFIGAEMVAEVVAESYTVTNPITQEPEERQTIRVIRERHVDDYFGVDDEPEPAPEPKPEPPKATAATSNSRGRGRRRVAQPQA